MTRRPAIGPVLAALTVDDDVAWWSSAATHASVRMTEHGVIVGHVYKPACRWAHETTDEAMEVLASRGLVPGHWCDPARAPWWRVGQAPWERVVDFGGPSLCALHRYPQSHADVVAVASLGIDFLERAGALSAELGRRAAWRVADERTLHEILRRSAWDRYDPHDAGASALYAFLCQTPRESWRRERWRWPLYLALWQLGAPVIGIADDHVLLGIEAMP